MKYYAVVCGIKPGIYTDWKTTQQMISGYPGAIFKSFSTREEAENFLKCSSSTNTSAKTTTPHILPLVNKTIIYTDGSYKDKQCGFGVIIITSTGEEITCYGKVPLTVEGSSNNVAELYAIYVGLSLVAGDVILYSDSRYCINSLSYYIYTWKNKECKDIPNKSLLEACHNLMQTRNVSLQYVPAHSGIRYNELCDQLANKGRMQEEGLVAFKGNTRVL